jgi:hypothetical protein
MNRFREKLMKNNTVHENIDFYEPSWKSSHLCLQSEKREVINMLFGHVVTSRTGFKILFWHRFI